MSSLFAWLFPGKAIRWDLSSHHLVKRCWVISVERSGRYEEVAAGGEFRNDLIQRCGVDTSRFSAVGLGLGLEWLSMIRYGIEDIRAVQLLND
jgi:phenylalanyl-tRNA synthetase alpha subunit